MQDDSLWPSWNGVPYAPQSVASSIAGPPAIGITFKLLLTGLAYGNFGQYLTTPAYRADPRAHKALLWGVVVLLTAFVALDCVACVTAALKQDRTVDGLFTASGEQAVGPVLGGLVAASVQGFLLVRAGKLFRNRRWQRVAFLAVGFFAIFICFLCALAETVATASIAFHFAPRMGPFTLNATAAAWLWSSAAIDVVLSLALILTIKKHIAGFNRNTDFAIRRIMKTAARTASYTTVCAVVAASLSVTGHLGSAKFGTFLAFSIPLPALYVLSLLSTMGARRTVRRAGEGASGSGGGGTSGGRARGARAKGRRLGRVGLGRAQRRECGPGGCVVRVTMETVRAVDQAVENARKEGTPLDSACQGDDRWKLTIATAALAPLGTNPRGHERQPGGKLLEDADCNRNL